MARGPEGRFWKKIRKAWDGHAQRVEASYGEADAGTPDSVLSIARRGAWVEVKVWPDNVSARQLAWHKDARSRGAGAWVLSQLVGDRVWLGTAEEYDQIVNLEDTPESISLQTALDMVACSLIGVAPSARRTK